MTVLPLYIHPVRALWAREQSSASKYWINTWGRTDLILAYWLFCGCASNSTKRLFWRLYRLFYWLFTIYRNAPCLNPDCASNSTKRLFWRLYRLFYWLFTIYRNAPCLNPDFCRIMVAISRKYYSRPKRNRKQWWCKFLGGKKVRYGSCENGEFLVFNWSQQNSKKKRTICPPTFLLSWSDVLEQLKTYILKRFSLRKGSSLEFL